LSCDLIGVLLTTEDKNTALRDLDAHKKSLARAEKKAEDAVGAKERLELELANAVAAKERLQQEATDREEQLATATASREKEVADKLMGAAKDISGELLRLPFFGFLVFPSCAFIYIVPSLSFRCRGHRV
jgi:chromosome segregation ATPase